MQEFSLKSGGGSNFGRGHNLGRVRYLLLLDPTCTSMLHNDRAIEKDYLHCHSQLWPVIVHSTNQQSCSKWTTLGGLNTV